MNKEQAKEEYIKIIKEVNKKQDAIIKKAKELGIEYRRGTNG